MSSFFLVQEFNLFDRKIGSLHGPGILAHALSLNIPPPLFLLISFMHTIHIYTIPTFRFLPFSSFSIHFFRRLRFLGAACANFFPFLFLMKKDPKQPPLPAPPLVLRKKRPCIDAVRRQIPRWNTPVSSVYHPVNPPVDRRFLTRCLGIFIVLVTRTFPPFDNESPR